MKKRKIFLSNMIIYLELLYEDEIKPRLTKLFSYLRGLNVFSIFRSK